MSIFSDIKTILSDVKELKKLQIKKLELEESLEVDRITAAMDTLAAQRLQQSKDFKALHDAVERNVSADVFRKIMNEFL